MADFNTLGGQYISARKTVAAAATPERLGSGACNGVTVEALAGNTGRVVVGGSNVDFTTQLGHYLSAGDAVQISVNDLSLVWLDVETNGEGVTYSYTKL